MGDVSCRSQRSQHVVFEIQPLSGAECGLNSRTAEATVQLHVRSWFAELWCLTETVVGGRFMVAKGPTTFSVRLHDCAFPDARLLAPSFVRF